MHWQKRYINFVIINCFLSLYIYKYYIDKTLNIINHYSIIIIIFGIDNKKVKENGLSKLKF